MPRKRDDFVGGIKGLLEAIEFFAGREVVSIFIGFEGKERTDEKAARASASRTNLVSSGRQCSVETQLRCGPVAQRPIGFV